MFPANKSLDNTNGPLAVMYMIQHLSFLRLILLYIYRERDFWAKLCINVCRSAMPGFLGLGS